MLRYDATIAIARRLLSCMATVVSVSVLTFVVIRVLPGDVAWYLLGAEATPDKVDELRAELGLSGSPLENYATWFAGVLSGDMGQSLASGIPVSSLLLDHATVTLQLLLLAFTAALGLAFAIALLAARRPHGWLDRLCLTLSVSALSMPTYAVALLLVLVFSIQIPLFPSIGFIPLSEGVFSNLKSLTLPSLAIALPLFGLYAQVLRSELLEQMTAETYVVTAAAKGLGRTEVLVRHALRNSVFGLLAIVSIHIGTLIGSSVVVEQVFALPGLGHLLLKAIYARDVVVIQGVVLFFAAVTVLIRLAVDVLYSAIDPRVRQSVF